MAAPEKNQLVDVFLYVILGLVLLTLMSPFVPQLSDKFRSGPSLVLVFAGLAAVLAVVIIRMVGQGHAFDQKTAFMMFLAFAIIVLAALFLRDLLPEAFNASLVALQATAAP